MQIKRSLKTIPKLARGVSNEYRYFNKDVELSHLLIKGDGDKALPPMIVLHGLLGSKTNWRGICKQPQISGKRDCYLVELRNHASSNHHDEMNYEVLSDDVVRFADSHGLDTFTILGHSLGGRTAMTTACRFEDRVDGVISIDSAPIDESGQNAFGSFTYGVIQFMHELSHQNLSRTEAVKRAREHFEGKPQFSALLETNMDRKSQDLQWLVNI